MPTRVRGWMLFVAIGGVLLCCPVEKALASEDGLLWSAPPSDSILITPFGGYTLGGQMDGAMLGVSGQALFQYFLLGIDANSLFIESGVSYMFGLNVGARLGPFHGECGLGFEWLPGRAQAQAPALKFQLGIQVPTPFEKIWLDLSYRPMIGFRGQRQVLYQQMALGLVFLVGA